MVTSVVLASPGGGTAQGRGSFRYSESVQGLG